MTLTLSNDDQRKLNGGDGPAVQMAMSILAQMAKILGAKELLDISAAHIDSTLYMGQATLEYAERLADLGAKVVVPTTLNVSGVDESQWQEWPVPQEWAHDARRQMIAYQSMGTIPTWTCAPYQSEYRPTFGQQIAWGESNAIAFANSVIGAQTERYPDLLDICAAITGRVPAFGLHLTENRAGQLLLSLDDIPEEIQSDSSFFAVLGNLMGKLAGEKIPVIQGLSVKPTEDQFKAMCAAGASAGAVALFHIVGVTPEAPTLEAAFQGKQPEGEISIDINELRRSWESLTTCQGNELDMVALGCPHLSIEEFRELEHLVKGSQCHPEVKFLVTTNRAMLARAESEGLVAPLKEFGAMFTLDTCILTTPMLPKPVRYIMTNSGKYSYYGPGLLNTKMVFGNLRECVDSAIEGKVVRAHNVWEGINK
jgi:cis-L-3-hydroxyproline dehydratase